MADSTNALVQIEVGQAQPAVTANENFAAMWPAACLGRIEEDSALLTWAYYGGQYRGLTIAPSTLTLTASQANLYLVVKKSDGVHSFSTATTNWNNLTDYDRVYRVTTTATAATVWEDKRGFFGGTGGGSGSVATDVIFDAKGDLPVGTGADTAAKLTVGTNGYVLSADSGEATGLKWIAASTGNVATDVIWDTKGDLAVATGADTASKLTVGTNGQVLTADSTQSTGTKWATPASGVTAFTGLSDVPSSYSGQGSKSVRVNSGATALEFFTPAGSGSVATDAIYDAKGDLPVGTGSDTAARLAVGTNGQVLTADSTQTTGTKWATPSAGAGATFTESSGAPGSPSSGDRWHDTDVGIMYTYSGFSSAWVEL